VAFSDGERRLAEYGVRFGANASQTQEVLMYVPHEVS
jgi:hypothetical protein